jgi:hypothetical protein
MQQLDIIETNLQSLDLKEKQQALEWSAAFINENEDK